jgi:hypothetical protein
MKKILLLVSGLLILCMAGSALANPFDPSILDAAGTAAEPTPINLAPGQSITLSFHGENIDEGAFHQNNPYGSTVKATGGGGADTDLTVETPTNFVPDAAIYTDIGAIKITNTAGKVSATYRVTIQAGDGQIEFGATSRTVNSIPEFPTVAAPIAGIIGLLFIFGRKKEGL